MPSIIPAVNTSQLVVKVRRGPMVESQHEVALIVSDLKGQCPVALGDPEALVMPRSAIKPLQALVMVECGAPAAFDLDARHLSFACASHNAEEPHLDLARDWLGRLGLGDDDLECGAHAPLNPLTGGPRYKVEPAGRISNNCSGKHLGFLSACRQRGWPAKGYIKARHDLQQAILGVMEQVCATDLSTAPLGIDGCGIPTLGVPLGHLALGMARFGLPQDLPDARAEACQSLMQAVWQEPFFIAGSDRCCTAVNAQMKGRVLAKVGAEGVYCAALPELGLGLALKAQDGSKRAAETALMWALDHLGVLTLQDRSALATYHAPLIFNSLGEEVGQAMAEPTNAPHSHHHH